MLIAFLNSLAGQMGAYPNAVFYGLVAVGVVLLAAALAGYWKIFEKMGEPGWKALVPFYSNWIIFRRCAEYWQLFIVYLVAGVVEFASNFGVFGIFSASVEEWARIICSGTEFYMLYELARCFGKGWAMGVGLWLAEFAFAPIIGFGSARYLGCHSASTHRFGTKSSAASHDVQLNEQDASLEAVPGAALDSFNPPDEDSAARDDLLEESLSQAEGELSDEASDGSIDSDDAVVSDDAAVAEPEDFDTESPEPSDSTDSEVSEDAQPDAPTDETFEPSKDAESVAQEVDDFVQFDDACAEPNVPEGNRA